MHIGQERPFQYDGILIVDHEDVAELIDGLHPRAVGAEMARPLRHIL
jgi:hypothetical protein